MFNLNVVNLKKKRPAKEIQSSRSTKLKYDKLFKKIKIVFIMNGVLHLLCIYINM